MVEIFSRRAAVIDAINHKPGIIPSHENFYDEPTRNRLVKPFNSGCWYIEWLLYTEYMDNYMIELHPHAVGVEILEDNRDIKREKLLSGAIRTIHKDPWFAEFSDFPIKSPEDVHKMDILDPDDPALYRDFQKAFDLYRRQGYFTVAGQGGSFFLSVALEWRGLEELLMDMALRPDFAEELFGKMGEYFLKKEKILLEMDVDCIYLEDDLGYKNAPLISPEMFKKFLYPWYKKFCDLAHANGCYTFMHSHGNINLLLADLIEAGVDIINPVGPTDNMDLAEVKQKYGDKVTLFGGLSKMMGFMDDETLEQHIEEVIRIGSVGGGFIPRGEAGVPAEMDQRKFLFYMHTLRKYRLKYSKFVH